MGKARQAQPSGFVQLGRSVGQNVCKREMEAINKAKGPIHVEGSVAGKKTADYPNRREENTK